MKDWAEKYRPSNLNEVVGNPTAVDQMKDWAKQWEQGGPKKKALILSGAPGIGKTSAAFALANDMGWEVIELNASDARNESNIHKVATAGAIHHTFSEDGSFVHVDAGGRKLIIFDEADSLFEQKIGGSSGASDKDKDGPDLSDRGGKKAIIETIRNTSQPIILIVNDLYALTSKSGAPLKHMCQTVKFLSPKTDTVKRLLLRIIASEGKTVNENVVSAIAAYSGGDIRGAINDLQSAYEGGEVVEVKNLHGLISKRDKKNSIFDSLRKLFKAQTFKDATDVAKTAEENTDMFMLWIDENLPRVYSDPRDLATAYDFVSKADIYAARVRRRQYYRFMAYSRDVLSGGAALAGRSNKPKPGFVKYEFPGYLKAMAKSKADRHLARSVGRKLGHHCHTSDSIVRETIIPLYRSLLKDHDFALASIRKLDLDEQELLFILNEDVLPEETKMALDHVEQLRKADKIKRVAKKKEPKKRSGPLTKHLEPESEEDSSKAEPKAESKPGSAEKDTGSDDQDAEKNQKSLFDF